MKWNPISRRSFLQGLGGFTLALPFLPSLAMGQQGPTAKRFISVFNANGMVPNQYYPAATPNINVAANIRALDLRGLSGPISDTFNSRFDRYKSKMLILRGVDCLQGPISGHDQNLMLGGKLTIGQDGRIARSAHVSIDQELAQSSKVYPVTPRTRSLLLIAHDGYENGSQSCAMISGTPKPLPSIPEPLTAWNLLFKGVQSAEPDRRKFLASKAVDLVFGDYKRVIASSKIGSEDRKTLEGHMSFLSELENRLMAQAPACTPPGLPGNYGDISDAGIRLKLQGEILAAAIRCGFTNIGALNLSHFSDNYSYNRVVSGLSSTVHHELAHSANWSQLQLLRRFWASGVADFLDLLDVVEDPNTGKTYLDNSLVYWGSENHTGADHEHISMPIALFGSAGGYFKTGYLVDYRNLNLSRPPGSSYGTKFYKGVPYNQFLVTLLQAFGLTPAEYEKYGQQGWGDYANPFNYDISNRRALLPFIVA